jgi:hypothetical protein
MAQVKRNKSIRKVGHSRGVPMRLGRCIAKKYDLSHIIILTIDKQNRSRVLYWATSDQRAMQCAEMCRKMEKDFGWETAWDWDCSSVRRMKLRIKELEAALAQIVDGEPDAIRLARAAGKFPDESDGTENNGAWIFYPQGKFNPSNERAKMDISL